MKLEPGLVKGQLFVREVGHRTSDLPETHELVCVFGVLAVPKGHSLRSEHQHAVVGAEAKGLGVLDLRVFTEHGVVDQTAMARGYDASGLLTSPIWRF